MKLEGPLALVLNLKGKVYIEGKIDKIKHCVVSLSRRDKFSIILRILTLNMIPIWHPQFSSATNVVLMIGSRKSFWGFGQIIIILRGGRTTGRRVVNEKD